MSIPTVSQIVSVQFALDNSRKPIVMDHPLTEDEKRKILLSGWINQDLENVVVMAPIRYAENESDFAFSLPSYLPIYSYEWGRSKYTIQRRYHNNIVSVHLVTDADFARWALNTATSTLTDRKESSHVYTDDQTSN